VEKLYLDPNVVVYRNAIPDPLGIIERAEKNRQWDKWYVFGQISHGAAGATIDQKTFPTEEEYEEYLAELYRQKNDEDLVKIERAFYDVSRDYVLERGITFEHWFKGCPPICKYFPVELKEKVEETLTGEGYEMFYHTDYPRDRIGEPEPKASLTVTMYLNDNYDGGDLMFKILNEDGSTRDVSHKPASGDIVIFPSRTPYYHAVRKVTNGFKYFVRNFWEQFEEASEDYLEGIAKCNTDEEIAAYLKARRKTLNQAPVMFYGLEPLED
jgi:hypothetical protein